MGSTMKLSNDKVLLDDDCDVHKAESIFQTSSAFVAVL